MTAESIDEAPARSSGAGRTAGQSIARRSTSARRSAAASTDPASTDAGTTDPAPTDAGVTGAVSIGGATTDAGLAGTSGGLSVVPAPTDPPTTELRGTVARPTGTPYPVTDRVPVAGPLPSNIYRARRPGVAILLIIPAVAVGVLLVQALATSAFGDSFDIAGIIASVCALVSLPFLVAGLYGLVSGAAHGAEQYGFRVWARPPLAYLLVGLAFVAAAGLAIS
ncbi:MAG: hypothetical protein IRY85_08650 [Micromonosporaceae bacterium]|nr:hypothetical protein [Micromonosporaceae bacterium]